MLREGRSGSKNPVEQETGCKIMVRAKGSMRDQKKEDANREHLSDDLHVLITVEDTDNRASIKLKRVLEEVKKLLVPHAEGEDELKKRQLMELAIINGTYRDSTAKAAAAEFTFDPQQFVDKRWKQQVAKATEARMLNPALAAVNLAAAASNQLAGRTAGNPLGAPIILSPRISVPTTAASRMACSAPPPTIDHTTGLIYASPFSDYKKMRWDSGIVGC
ncbi:protein held out wings-like [Anopheles albimanus]|uniref:protein held out wings-like n=1 Tax=Anopheles albimanus TaxID=7167 RepID=UPI001642211F|nr:protein held out wings-like [Anopheles albimanus]